LVEFFFFNVQKVFPIKVNFSQDFGILEVLYFCFIILKVISNLKKEAELQKQGFPKCRFWPTWSDFLANPSDRYIGSNTFFKKINKKEKLTNFFKKLFFEFC